MNSVQLVKEAREPVECELHELELGTPFELGKRYYVKGDGPAYGRRNAPAAQRSPGFRLDTAQTVILPGDTIVRVCEMHVAISEVESEEYEDSYNDG